MRDDSGAELEVRFADREEVVVRDVLLFLVGRKQPPAPLLPEDSVGAASMMINVTPIA